MTELITLGNKPKRLVVPLYPGTPFVATIRTKDGKDWPVGTGAILEFDGTTSWSATLAGNTLLFAETAATVDLLLGTNPKKARLFYDDATYGPLPWALGGIEVAWP